MYTEPYSLPDYTLIVIATPFTGSFQQDIRFFEQRDLKDKAIPIKCFVSHHPTDPFFWKSKKKSSESLVKKQVL